MPSVFKWSKTASANANSDSDINWSEGQLPGTVNNSSRSEMAGIANYRDDQGGQLTTAGTQPAYTLTTNSVLTALADGTRLHFVAHATNTGAATLNVDSLGAKAIRKGADAALVAGDVVANGHYLCQYDASANTAAGAWLLLNPSQGVAFDITNLTAETTLATDDTLPIYDTSESANNKITVANFLKIITALAAETAPAVDDEIALYDLSTTTVDKITLANLLKVVNGLTAETAPAADDQLLLYDISAGTADKVSAGLVNPFGLQLLHVRDEKTSGTAGGAFTAGGWRTRTLNTVVTNEITGASLASNQISLPAGTYYVHASAPASDVNSHQTKLINVTDATNLVIGSSDRLVSGSSSVSRSFVNGRFTLAATKNIELQHQSGSTGTFGVASAFGVVEVYADVQIWKLA